MVLKNNPNYVNFFYEDDIQLQIQVLPPPPPPPPPPGWSTVKGTMQLVWQNFPQRYSTFQEPWVMHLRSQLGGIWVCCFIINTSVTKGGPLGPTAGFCIFYHFRVKCFDRCYLLLSPLWIHFVWRQKNSNRPCHFLANYCMSRNFREVFIFANWIKNAKIKTREYIAFNSSMKSLYHWRHESLKPHLKLPVCMQSCWIWKICHYRQWRTRLDQDKYHSKYL